MINPLLKLTAAYGFPQVYRDLGVRAARVNPVGGWNYTQGVFLTLYRPKLYRALRFRSIEKTGIPNPPWAFGGLLPPLGLLDSFAIGYEVVKLGLSPAISPRPQLFHPSSRQNTAQFMVISRRVRSHQFIPNSQLGKRRALRD